MSLQSSTGIAGLLDAVLPVIEEAASLIRAEIHRPGGRRLGNGYDKAPIDTEIEQFLKDRLTALHPADWQGEELPRILTGHPYRWIVDPQDGTRAFLKGLRGPAISVALVRDHRPVLAVVHAPTAPDDGGDVFAWAEGRPVTRNGKELTPLNRKSFGAQTVVILNESAGDYARANHAALNPAGIIAMPSIAYRLALAAAGEADVALNITHGLNPHDVAAGLALIEALGGVVLDLEGQPLPLTPEASFHGCVGGAPGVVQIVRERAQRLSRAFQFPRDPARPRTRTADPQCLSRAQGTLLGQFAGDALGAQVEFKTPSRIKADWPGGVRELHPGGTWNLLAGQITDDSEMALALARSIAALGGFDPRAVGQAYQGWMASDPFDIGTTTSAGIRALSGRGKPNAQSEANGALMRVAPIGVAASTPQEAAEWARQDAALTHPNPLCQEASAAFAAAIQAAISGAYRQGIWSVAQAAVDPASEAGQRILSTLQEAPDRPVTDAVTHQGWVLIALRNAFHHLMTAESFEEALVSTVMMGGDTDTNAAICGALLGAAMGREAIPLPWRRQILGQRAVDLPGTHHPRPAAFWTDDTLDLAEALLTTRHII